MAYIEPKTIDEIFTALDRQLRVHEGAASDLVVCGGTALAALNLVARTTKDVDILGIVITKAKSLSVKKIERFPEWLDRAAKKVARDFDLPENWLNLGPASQLETGLPKGFEKRLIKRRYGQYLTIYYISRLDQIHFKLYASVDRDDYHVQDLIALKPSDDEMLMASKWIFTQDVSEEFKKLLTDFLEKHGYETIAQGIQR